jgi:hypothetical protein
MASEDDVNDFADHLRYISPELGELYDWASEEDTKYDEWRQRQDDEREMILEDALTACLNAGVDREHLKTLARETGAQSWALRNSLKEKV